MEEKLKKPKQSRRVAESGEASRDSRVDVPTSSPPATVDTLLRPIRVNEPSEEEILLEEARREFLEAAKKLRMRSRLVKGVVEALTFRSQDDDGSSDSSSPMMPQVADDIVRPTRSRPPSRSQPSTRQPTTPTVPVLVPTIPTIPTVPVLVPTIPTIPTMASEPTLSDSLTL